MRFPFIFIISIIFSNALLANESIALDPHTNNNIESVLRSKAMQDLAESKEWKKLLHAESTGNLSIESQVDSANFFLSADGKYNLKAELDVNIEALLRDKDKTEEMDTFQCRFPARYRLLKKILSELNVTWIEKTCPRLKRYHDALKGQSVSLIFSSYYINNPASAFGHTFLRINKLPTSEGKRYELLDYGLNYAATVDTENALVYALKGLFGYFDGKFTSVPYYYKVREYNDSESLICGNTNLTFHKKKLTS